jgi:hypothetical protein
MSLLDPHGANQRFAGEQPRVLGQYGAISARHSARRGGHLHRQAGRAAPPSPEAYRAPRQSSGRSRRVVTSGRAESRSGVTAVLRISTA